MPPCARCGTGKRRGRGKGWCSNVACREAEKREKEEEKRLRQAKKQEKQEKKRLRQEEREQKGACERGPCPGEGRPGDAEGVRAAKKAKQEEKRLRQEEREEKGAGERGPCPGEGGRPEDTEEVQAEKLEARGSYIRIKVKKKASMWILKVHCFR